MSVGPRIVFMRFVRHDSPKLTPWRAHTARVMGSPVPATTPKGDDEWQLVWQLISANNRQLARSAEVYTSFEEATEGAQAVVAAVSSLQIELVSEAGRGLYGWYATIADVPVMSCARWYLTERDRRHSVALALRSVASATLLAGSRLTDPERLGSQSVLQR